jgi:hypothetical protein
MLILVIKAIRATYRVRRASYEADGDFVEQRMWTVILLPNSSPDSIILILRSSVTSFNGNTPFK